MSYFIPNVVDSWSVTIRYKFMSSKAIFLSVRLGLSYCLKNYFVHYQK